MKKIDEVYDLKVHKNNISYWQKTEEDLKYVQKNISKAFSIIEIDGKYYCHAGIRDNAIAFTIANSPWKDKKEKYFW